MSLPTGTAFTAVVLLTASQSVVYAAVIICLAALAFLVYLARTGHAVDAERTEDVSDSKRTTRWRVFGSPRGRRDA
jgi:uncharacterized membrane protein